MVLGFRILALASVQQRFDLGLPPTTVQEMALRKFRTLALRISDDGGGSDGMSLLVAV